MDRRSGAFWRIVLALAFVAILNVVVVLVVVIVAFPNLVVLSFCCYWC